MVRQSTFYQNKNRQLTGIFLCRLESAFLIEKVSINTLKIIGP